MNISEIKQYSIGKVPYAALVEINKRILELVPDAPWLAVGVSDDLLGCIQVLEGEVYPDELYDLCHLKSEIENEHFYFLNSK